MGSAEWGMLVECDGRDGGPEHRRQQVWVDDDCAEVVSTVTEADLLQIAEQALQACRRGRLQSWHELGHTTAWEQSKSIPS